MSPAWPIDYDTLEPYYARAEALYQVRGTTAWIPTEPPRGAFPREAVPHSRGMSDIVDQLKRLGLHPSPLPLGLRGRLHPVQYVQLVRL
jgi:choline dehydrogenase-like flavoprotein